jgi:hypothetical protein
MDLKERFRVEPLNFVSRKEAAFLLACSVTSVSRYIAEGRLMAVRIAKRRILVYKPSLWDLLEQL